MRLRAFAVAVLLTVSMASRAGAVPAVCSSKPVKYRVAAKLPPYEDKEGRSVRWYHIAIEQKDNTQGRLVRLGCQLWRKFRRKGATVQVLVFTDYEIARRYRPPGSESPLTAREAEAPLVAWYERDDKTGTNRLSYYPDPLNKRESVVRLELVGLCKCPHER